MTLTTIIIITLAVGSIISALLLVKQSAKKFNLTPEQLAKIKARKKQQENKDKERDKLNS